MRRRLEIRAPRRADDDVVAFHLQIGLRRAQQDALLRLHGRAALRARERHRLLRARAQLAGVLRLHTHRAGRRVQRDAPAGNRPPVARRALRIQRDAVIRDDARLALRRQLHVLSGAQHRLGTRHPHVALRRHRGQPRLAVCDEMRLAPRNRAAAPAACRIAAASFTRRADRFTALLDAIDGRQRLVRRRPRRRRRRARSARRLGHRTARLRALLVRERREALQRLSMLSEHLARRARIHLAHAGRRADQEPRAAAQRAGGIRRQFRAIAAIGLAPVVLRLLHVPEREPAVAVRRVQARARLARRIVEHELPIAARALLAHAHVLRLETRQHRRMRIAGEPCGRIAGAAARPSRLRVVLRVRVAAAVVERGHRNRPVGLAFEPFGPHFLPDARHAHPTPVIAAHGRHHPRPRARATVRRRVRRMRVIVAARRILAALRVVLDSNPVIPVGVNGIARAHDDRRLRPRHHGDRVHARAMAGCGERPIRLLGGQRDEAIAIDGVVPHQRSAVMRIGAERRIQRARGAMRHRRGAGDRRNRAEALFDRAAHGRIDVRARRMLDAQADERIRYAERRMMRDRKTQPGPQIAARAAAFAPQRGHALGVELLLRAPVSDRARLVCVRARDVAILARRDRAVRARARRTRRQAAVIPARARDAADAPTPRVHEVLDAALRVVVARLMKADDLRFVRREALIRIGEHERVLAEARRARVAFVLEPVEDALLRPEPLEEVEIGLAGLRGQAALRVLRRIGERPSPCGRDHAARVTAEHLFADLDDARVQIVVAVDALPQQREPRLDDEPHACESAVVADELGGDHVAVERPARVAPFLRLPFDQDRRTDQLRERQRRMLGERGELQTEAAIVERLPAVQAFRDERVRAERRRDPEKAVVLRPAAEECLQNVSGDRHGSFRSIGPARDVFAARVQVLGRGAASACGAKRGLFVDARERARFVDCRRTPDPQCLPFLALNVLGGFVRCRRTHARMREHRRKRRSGPPRKAKDVGAEIHQ
ncbi:hypothetical protein BURPS1710b_1770 [Burkholderia pseudomallei 1710b]|uniref:Uncharacterized protein n=1 Tax=Burkholderia pseudomallei (strain 1710b) TaxID=320372 RepID=Q3JTD2_BURP1|nr:hypothetical protein BURPS1710b_1770 [Burkholderia pseudomallei 1710b]